MGEFAQGGIIFYSGVTVFSTGTTVFIAALEDIEIPLYWGCYSTAVSGTSTGIGTGSENTSLIIDICTGNTMIAANVCANYSFSGYTDWFLPSKDELNQMYLQQDLIGGFDIYSNYWSSSQNMPETAWMQYFLNGTQSNLGQKDQLYKVRPIRIMT